MKMKVFEGRWYEAMDAFNKWAKGKQLNRDVIIQTHTVYNVGLSGDVYLYIVVIHPEDPFWDATQGEPIPGVQLKAATSPRVEREAIAQ
jgi:hypothetical protein